MTDTYVGIPQADLWLHEPDFQEPRSRLTFDKTQIKGASPNVAIEKGFGLSRWEPTFRFVTKTHKERAAFFRFWRDRRGLVRSFWLPTWSADFKPNSGITAGDDFIDVEAPVGASQSTFGAYYDDVSDKTDATYSNPTAGKELENRWGVMIVTGKGPSETKHFRAIDKPGTPGGYEKAVFAGVDRIHFEPFAGAEQLPETVDKPDITLISLVMRMRCSTGRLPFVFDNDAVASANQGFVEVFYEAVTGV